MYALTRLRQPATRQGAFEHARPTSFYVRPGYGKAGRQLSLLANFFVVRAEDKRGKVIQSVIEFTSQLPTG